MPILKTWKTCKAAFLSGKAFKCMEKGNYRGAAIVLMGICRLKPEYNMMEYLYYSLGRCHYRLSQPHSSLFWLSKSIKLYKNGLNKRHKVRYQQNYRDAIGLYCKVLRIVGCNEKADEFINHIDYGS